MVIFCECNIYLYTATNIHTRTQRKREREMASQKEIIPLNAIDNIPNPSYNKRLLSILQQHTAMFICLFIWIVEIQKLN